MMESIWKKVWDLDNIRRHRMLIWKILNNALPVRDSLQKQGINCSLLCPRCEAGIETIDHLFHKCEFTKREFFGSRLGIIRQEELDSNFNDWLLSFILNHDKSTIIKLAALLYSIWHARNQKVFENIDVPGDVIIKRSCNNIISFNKAKASDPLLTITPDLHATVRNSPSKSTRDRDKARWIKPDLGIIKINSDVNLTSSDFWGIGVIARDESGTAIAAGTWKRPGFACPTTAEAWGIYQATLFAQELGLRNVHFESDNEQVIQMLLGQREYQKSYLGYIICSIRSLLHFFRSYQFSHIRRNGNVVANCLAQIATIGPNRIWLGEVPIEAQSLYSHGFVS